MNAWRDNTPIYLQLKERLIGEVLDESLTDGDAAPSVRQVASDMQVNPLTVSRAYQELTDEGVLEKRRGLGTFVATGARSRLLIQERQRFLEQEWPLTLERIRLLDLDINTLLKNSNGETA